MKCIFCGKESGRSKFCRSCRETKQNAGAMVSQNKKKLVNLLDGDWLSPNAFARFQLYCDNILRNGKILMKFKEMDVKRTFSNILSEDIRNS